MEPKPGHRTTRVSVLPDERNITPFDVSEHTEVFNLISFIYVDSVSDMVRNGAPIPADIAQSLFRIIGGTPAAQINSVEQVSTERLALRTKVAHRD